MLTVGLNEACEVNTSWHQHHHWIVKANLTARVHTAKVQTFGLSISRFMHVWLEQIFSTGLDRVQQVIVQSIHAAFQSLHTFLKTRDAMKVNIHRKTLQATSAASSRGGISVNTASAGNNIPSSRYWDELCTSAEAKLTLPSSKSLLMPGQRQSSL